MMKRLAAFVLAISMLFALCACGTKEDHQQTNDGTEAEATEQEPDNSDEDLLAKYRYLIDILEAGNYDYAIKIIKNMMPPPEEPVYTEIELSMDNWQDYFEIRPFFSESYDIFGDTTSRDEGYAIYLKDEYISSISNKYLPDHEGTSSSIAFKVLVSSESREYDMEHFAFVDNGRVYEKETKEYIFYLHDHRSGEDTKEHVSTGSGQVYALLSGISGLDDHRETPAVYYRCFITNIEVIDVGGSLLLAS